MNGVCVKITNKVFNFSFIKEGDSEQCKLGNRFKSFHTLTEIQAFTFHTKKNVDYWPYERSPYGYISNFCGSGRETNIKQNNLTPKCVYVKNESHNKYKSIKLINVYRYFHQK